MAVLGELIDAAAGALEPAVDVAVQDCSGIGRDRSEGFGAGWAGAQQRGAGERLLAVRGHHRLAGRAARGWVAQSAGVLGEELAAAAVVSSGLVGGGVDENVYSVAGRADGEETEAEKTAQTVHAAVAVAASARGGDGEPHLVGGAHAVGGLQEELEREAEFHFDDGQGHWVAWADGDDVAAADFAFDGEAGGFEEAFDGWVEGGFGHGMEGAIRRRVGAMGAR